MRCTRTLKRMDEMAKFKAFLGSAAEGYGQVQLRQLHREMHAMAELLLDIYLYRQRDTTKAPTPDFDRLPPSP